MQATDDIRAKVLKGEILVIDDFIQPDTFGFLKDYIPRLEFPVKASYAGKIVEFYRPDQQKIVEHYHKFGIVSTRSRLSGFGFLLKKMAARKRGLFIQMVILSLPSSF